jgi:hypothetical protein
MIESFKTGVLNLIYGSRPSRPLRVLQGRPSASAAADLDDPPARRALGPTHTATVTAVVQTRRWRLT